jgi:hypothetical protein
LRLSCLRAFSGSVVRSLSLRVSSFITKGISSAGAPQSAVLGWLEVVFIRRELGCVQTHVSRLPLFACGLVR